MSRQTVLISVLAFVLSIALWWMFFMSPQRQQVTDIDADTEAVQAEGVVLETRIASLESVRSRASIIESAIATLEGVVPSSTSMPSALQQIQAAADDSGLIIAQMGTARPALVDEETGLHAIEVNLAGVASYFQIVDFLRRLEDPGVTIRGVDVTSVTIDTLEHPALSVTITASLYAVLDTAVVPEPAAVPVETPSEES